MANKIANISLGRFVHYCTLPAANDALILIPIETTGLESDAAIVDHDTVSAMLAAANNEQTNQARKAISSGITITIDDTNERVDVDIPTQTYTAWNGNAVSKMCIAYDPDTTGGTDADLVPISYHDFVVDPDGTDVNADPAAAGFARAAAA